MSKHDYRNDPDEIKALAKYYNWTLVQFEVAQGLLGFKRNGQRVNVYYTKMTIATALDHPMQGRTQLYRKNVSDRMIERIFQNPRVHTKRGYRRKSL